MIGSGETVINQSPSASVKINKENGKVILYTEGDAPSYAKVPKLEGLTATEAIKLLVDAGFNVTLSGATEYDKGVGATVIAQSVAAGSELMLGETVSITIRYLDIKE